MNFRALVGGLLAVPFLMSPAQAGGPPTFEVSITNLTRQQSFTPILVATHPPEVRLFELGQPASAELEILAEAGMTGPLAGALTSAGATVMDIGGLAPGATVTRTIVAGRGEKLLTVASMLIPTNDTFFAVNGVELPRRRQPLTVYSPGYDAGTEENDQNCANIPGPRCNGIGSSAPADGDEGRVYIGNGFHELGDDEEPSASLDGEETEGEILGPLTYDWRNPVAQIRVRRIRSGSGS